MGRDTARPYQAFCAASVVILSLIAFVPPSLLAAEKTATPPRSPDRAEIWVPSKDLEKILRDKKDAVLLTPDQYNALIRDAGKLKPGEAAPEPPTGAVVESIRLNGKAADGAGSIALQGEITIKALAKGWSIATVDLPWKSISRITADDGILFSEATSEQAKGQSAPPSERIVVLVSGPGERRARFESTAALSRGSSPDERILFYRPTQSPATLALDLPAGSLISQGPARESKGDSHRFLLSGQPNGQSIIAWRQPAPAGMAARISGLSIRGTARFSESELTASYDVALSSSATDAPAREITFTVSPADAAVIAVEGSEIESWSQNGSALTARFTVESRSPQLRIELRQPIALPEKNPLPLELPAVRLDASQQAPAVAALSFDEGVELLELSAARSPAANIAEWDAQKQKAIAVIRRALPRLVVDADARVFAARDFVEIDRAVNVAADRPVDRLQVTLPEGEEFLEAAHLYGPKLDWKRTGQVVDVEWQTALDAASQGRLSIKSRKKITVAENAAAVSTTITNLLIPAASKLAGYIALDSDPAWRLAVTEASGLEDRDARLAPVKGRMAWFNLRDFKLVFQAERRESIVDAEITAYALPRASSIEIEGQAALDISGAPLRQIEVRCAKESAKLLRFTSPLVGEQSLDEATGAWKLTLAKETTGRVNLRFRMSMAGQAAGLPAADQNGQAGGSSRLSAMLPRFEMPAARRFRGSWVVEANTDTQLSFDAKSLQPIDVMRVPAVEGYSPRHRLVAAYAYGTGEHSLAITATRHPHSELASLIVSRLAMTSALSEDGSSRHEAVLELRHTGEQFAQASLPAGSQILSAVVDGSVVKPVVVQAAASGSEAAVRIALPLPGGSANRDTITARILWEQPGEKWAASGSRDLLPLAILGNTPILATDWKIFAPEGYTFRKTDTTMEQSGTLEPEGIVGKLNPLSLFAGPVFASPARYGYSADEQAVAAATSSPVARGLPSSETSKDPFAPQDPKLSPREEGPIADKLRRIVIPEIDFQSASVAEAIEFLRIQSRDMDADEPNPASRGVNFIIQEGDTPNNAQITLNLSKVPLGEALKFITDLSGMKYRIEPYAVIVTPLSSQSDTMYTRVFRVPPNFPIAADTFLGRIPSKSRSAKDVLVDAGVGFSEGASAIYSLDNSRQLVAKNTQANLDLVEQFIARLPAEPKSALIVPESFTISRGPQPLAGAEGALQAKLERIILPSIQLSRATIEEAAEFLRMKARELNPDQSGIEIMVQPDERSKTNRITLDLNDVPMLQAARYIADLAGLRLSMEGGQAQFLPYGDWAEGLITRVYAVPNHLSQTISSQPAQTMLVNQGIAFPTGSKASFDRSSNQLTVTNVIPNIDLVEAWIRIAWEESGEKPPIDVSALMLRQATTAGLLGDVSKSGLLPLDLDLPASGQLLRFSGAQAPEALRLRYVSWERQMAWAVAMMAAGGLLFAAWGRRRPWLRSLLVILLLALAVKVFAVEWLPLANAAVFGWLAALVLWLVWRLFAGIEKRFAKGGHRHAEV